MTLRNLLPFGDDLENDGPRFETGVTRRREIAPFEYQHVDLVVHGDGVEIAGAHRERVVEARQGYSSLGSGGPLTYPHATRRVVVVTARGKRLHFSRDEWEKLLRSSYDTAGRRP